MKKLLTFTMVLGLVFGVLPTAFAQHAPTAQNAAKKQAQAEAHKSELVQKYGFTYEQLQQYLKLEQERDAKIKTLNQQKIPDKERKKETKNIRKDFVNKVEKIMTPQQKNIFGKERDANEKQSQASQKILQEYASEFKKLGKQVLANPQEEKEKLHSKYEAQLVLILGKEKAHSMIVAHENQMITRNSPIKNLDISHADQMQLADKKRKQAKKLARIREDNIPEQAQKEKRDQLKERYRQGIEQQVGATKAAQYKRLQETVFDRLAQKSGLSDRQLAQLKEIENQRAIETLKIKKSNLLPDEKQSRTASVNDQADQQVRQLLNAEQYKKYHLERAKQDARKRKK